MKRNIEKRAKRIKTRLMKVVAVLLGCATLSVFFVESVMAVEQVFSVGMPAGEIAHLDPHLSAADNVKWVTEPICEPLIKYDAKMNLVPSLAVKWEFTDPVTFQWELRKGVRFHNGRELTAADVKFSVERVKDPNTGSWLMQFWNSVESVEVTGEYTGIFHLKEPDVSLVTVSIPRLSIIPQEAVEHFKTQPIGTGPFRFEKWFKGEKLVLVKNEDYWNDGLPYLDKLTFRFLPEYQTAIMALLKGEVDMLTRLKNDDVAQLKKAGLVIIGKSLYGHFYIGCNCTRSPYDNVKVRQAIKYAVDKEACVASALGGYGKPKDININEGSPYYTEDFNYDQDIEKAKELLKEAGYPNGFEDTLICPSGPPAGPLGDLMQYQLGKIGIKLKLEKLLDASFIDLVFVKRDYGIMICGYAGLPDLSYFNNPYLITDGPTNVFNYSNPKVDEYLTKAKSVYSVEERKKWYYKAYEILIEEAPLTFFFNEYINIPTQPYVKGLVVKPTFMYDFTSVYIKK